MSRRNLCPRCSKPLKLESRHTLGTPDDYGFVNTEIWACACGHREERERS